MYSLQLHLNMLLQRKRYDHSKFIVFNTLKYAMAAQRISFALSQHI